MTGPIYTRGGDQGETSLADGSRTPKSSARVRACGTIDEANSAVGLVRASLQVTIDEEARLDRVLNFVQQRLMNCASRTATLAPDSKPDTPSLSNEDIERLEEAIDGLISAAGEIDHFVLPTWCEEAARCHIARTVVRRAERELVALSESEPVDPLVLKFVNRTSDVMFAAARYANAVYGTGDVFWDPEY